MGKEMKKGRKGKSFFFFFYFRYDSAINIQQDGTIRKQFT
jgi:hypothetical protein